MGPRGLDGNVETRNARNSQNAYHFAMKMTLEVSSYPVYFESAALMGASRTVVSGHQLLVRLSSLFQPYTSC